MEHKFCQSCGMPLTTDNKGTNADGSRNEDYCIIASGPQTPRVGGVILIKAESRAVVDSIIEQDPFNINGVADYRIVEFTPTMFVDSSLSDILK